MQGNPRERRSRQPTRNGAKDAEHYDAMGVGLPSLHGSPVRRWLDIFERFWFLGCRQKDFGF
jgi:hypothetical protein